MLILTILNQQALPNLLRPRPLRTAISRIVEWRRWQRFRAELNGLAAKDDHLLRDIGLTRRDIALAMIAAHPTEGWQIIINAYRRAHLPGGTNALTARQNRQNAICETDWLGIQGQVKASSP